MAPGKQRNKSAVNSYNDERLFGISYIVPNHLLSIFSVCLSLAMLVAPTYSHATRNDKTNISPYRGGEHYSGSLLTYTSNNSRVYALVATPTQARKKYPVIIANHGNHPNPPQYGITKDGADWRPGDYYRKIPSAFTARGFIVVMPDYRGHNKSAGGEVAKGFLATHFYAQDVLSLLPHIPNIPLVDPEQIYMWGHSMGGDVTLRALRQTDSIKAASIWSTVGGDIWEQAYYYSRARTSTLTHTPPTKDLMGELKQDLARYPQIDWQQNEPLLNLDKISVELQIHHALGDQSTAYDWSRQLAAKLSYMEKTYKFYSYSGADHLFTGQQFDQAVSRDVKFFSRHDTSLAVTIPK